MPRAIGPSTDYPTLLRLLRAEIRQARADVERRLIQTYWNTGRAIGQYLNHHPDSTLAAVTRRLSQDLAIHIRTLQHCHQFFVAYPGQAPAAPISWSHYRVLLTLPSAAQRQRWERRIIKERLSQKDLLALLHQQRHPAPAATGARLPDPPRGALYHYRVIRVGQVGQAGGLMVDCGFAICVEPPEYDGTLTNKRIVRSQKADGHYRLLATDATADQLYTYQAQVERVVDGDTLAVNVDCGFGIWIRQKLRLKGIDTPELNTVAGLQAKQWVEGQLTGVPRVIIRTHKADKYDRYLADVFYQTSPAPGAQPQDHYLNQALLDQGLARLYPS